MALVIAAWPLAGSMAQALAGLVFVGGAAWAALGTGSRTPSTTSTTESLRSIPPYRRGREIA